MSTTDLNLKFRTLHPEVKIVDAAAGLVDYVASDETLDHHREVIRANGWRFNHFEKNAPFVDSHNYGTIEKLLGKVIEFKVEGRKLIERVQYSLEEGTLAHWAFKMVRDGFLKAVSVGFSPSRMATKWDADRTNWLQQLREINAQEESGIRTIYVEQEQIELSQCILGANPNALARAYAAKCLTEADIDALTDLKARGEADHFRNENETTREPGPERATAEATNRRKLALLAAIQSQLN